MLKEDRLKLNLISRNLCLVNLSGMRLLPVLGTDVYSMPKLVFCSTAGTLVSFLFAKSRRTVFRDATTPCQCTQNGWQSIQSSSASVLYVPNKSRIFSQFFIAADSDFPEFCVLYGTRQLNLAVMGTFRHQKNFF